MTNSNLGKKRILFVEDEEEAQELVSFYLTDHSLVIARDFAEGLRMARQRYFDLYILDNWLPGGTGIELCHLIREFDPYTPVVFLSAVAFERDVRDALNAGAQIYITKPSDLDELKLAVTRLISAASERAIDARLAEFAAIREELAVRSEGAKMKLIRAEEKALRAKAKLAFLAAGGARGDFARLWPLMYLYLREVRNRRND
jgi:DNA-binding response OmpR family regulator